MTPLVAQFDTRAFGVSEPLLNGVVCVVASVIACCAALKVSSIALVRCAGALVDTLVVAGCGSLAFAFIGLFGLQPQLMPGGSADEWLRFAALPMITLGLELAPVLIIAVVYLVIFVVLRGQTPGMKVARVYVVDPALRAPSYGRSTARALFQVAGLMFGAINLFWVIIDRERRTLHDRLSNTYTIQRGNC